jgi:hypothetical protein
LPIFFKKMTVFIALLIALYRNCTVVKTDYSVAI